MRTPLLQPAAPPSDAATTAAARPVRPTVEERYRIAICRGDRCPRCQSGDTRPWGRFSGRRRFRCRGCGRTFSTFTGTPLHYVKRPARWPRFLRAADARASIRATARAVGVHPSTAFRWRHRHLADRRRRDRTTLAGRVSLEAVHLAENRKGRRDGTRPPRTHGYPYPHRIPRASLVQVALFWQDDTATLAVASRPGGGGGPWLADVLRLHTRAVTELVTALPLPLPLPRAPRTGREDPPPHGNARWAVGRGTGRQGPGPCGPRVVSPLLGAERRAPHLNLHQRLRQWLRPFRGVATRYLEHYLQWFRDDLAAAPVPTSRPPPGPQRDPHRRSHLERSPFPDLSAWA